MIGSRCSFHRISSSNNSTLFIGKGICIAMGDASMSEQLPSLQVILQQRQQQEFVGREEQISLFRENLFFKPDDDRRRFVFNIYGQGGVGKTSLLDQLFQLAKYLSLTPAWTDEWQGDALAVMVHLAEQFDPRYRFFKAFQRRYQAYRKLCQELEADPQAPKGSLAAFVRQTLIKVTIRAGHNIPVGGAVMSLVDEDNLATKIEEGALYIARKLKNPDNRRLVQEPLAVLTPLFVKGLNKYANRENSPRFLPNLRRSAKSSIIPIFFDTYERTGDFLDEWLRGIIAGRYGEVPSTIILIISGRDELNRDHWIPYWDVVAPLNLEPFSEQEVRLYLSRKGITDQSMVDVIFRLSGGLPLLVATLASEHPDDPAQVGDPSGTAVDRFLKWIDDPVRRLAVVQAALPRYLNKDILKELVGDQAVSTFFSWLIERPFVKVDV
jgi:hypothetical protein